MYWYTELREQRKLPVPHHCTFWTCVTGGIWSHLLKVLQESAESHCLESALQRDMAFSVMAP